MITALLLLALAVPPPAPDPAVERAALAELDACLDKLEQLAPSSTTAPMLEQLARAAQRYDACAGVGWVRAIIAEQALAELRRAPLLCPPPPAAEAPQACEGRPLFVDLLSHGGACAACSAAAVAICTALPR